MKQALVFFLFLIFNYYAFCNTNLNRLQDKDSLQYYSLIANKPESNLSLANAYEFFNKQKDACIKRHDTVKAIDHLRQLAIIQNELGDYYGCETNIVLALKYLDKLKVTKFTNESKVGLYNQLGRVYLILLDHDNALKYFKEGLKIAKSQAHINIIKNNIALVYIKQLNYKLAEALLSEVYTNSLTLGDSEQTARALDNLGYVQSKLSRPIAYENLKSALKMRLEIKDNYGLYSSYKYLSEYYKDKNDNAKASFYANKAYDMAKTVNSTSYIEDALSTIISLSSDSKILEYRKLKDSITSAKQIANNKYALIKYNYLKKENEAKAIELKFKESELKTEKEKLNKIIYQSILFLVFLMAISLYFIIRANHRKDSLQQIYNTETRISKKVHDEVANDVYHIMTKLQSKNHLKNTILDDLESIYIKTRDISKENSIIDVHENYNALLKDLLLSYKNDSINVIIKNISKTDWNMLSDLKKITLFRVLQELMTNMRKHSKASLVALTFKVSGQKIIIDYKDNGIGCNLIKYNGLLNTENRMASIKGTITFESEPNKGFKVQIII